MDSKNVMWLDNDYKLISLDSSLEDISKNTYDYMGYIEDTNYLVVASNGNYKLIDFKNDFDFCHDIKDCDECPFYRWDICPNLIKKEEE